MILCVLVFLTAVCSATDLEWGYTDSTTATCGTTSQGGQICGPNKWARVSEACSTVAHESPININVELHASHELDELRWEVEECNDAVLSVDTHYWKIEFSEGCKGAYATSRFGHTYYARSIEFHSPSEHTFDLEHQSMEVQIIHTDATNTRHLGIAVALEASSTFPENPFLAPFWNLATEAIANATNSTATNLVSSMSSSSNTIISIPTFAPFRVERSFAKGALNFVDYLLPSHGLSFDYVLYEGSATSPNCAEMKWVVMRYAGRMSQPQLQFFLSAMAAVNNTNARIDGSNNRPTQTIGSRVQELYEDSDCYVRYCHNIFSLGQVINLQVSATFLGILIVFTLFFESISHFLQHNAASRRTAREMLAKVYKELSVLGLVSFVTFSINSSCNVTYISSNFVEFEFVHILLFAVAILYVLFAAILLGVTSHISQQWDKVLYMEGQELLAFVDTHYKFLCPTSWHFLGRPGPYIDLGLFYCHNIFIQRHELPGNFDFLKYIKYYLSHNIKHQLDISPKLWIILVIVLLMWAGICVLGNIVNVYGVIGWMNALILFWNWILCNKSFKRLLKMLGVVSYEKLKEKVKNIPAQHSKVYYTKALVEARKELATTGAERKRNAVARADSYVFASPRDVPLETGRTFKPVTSRSNIDHASFTRKRKELEKLKTCWLPFGSPMLIRTTSDTALLAMCFYFGFFVLNARSYLSYLQSILVVVSSAIVVGILLPLNYIVITVIQALVEPDFELIGEVMEYTEELHHVRCTLVENLFPEINNRLYSDMTRKEAEDMLSHFDMDGDCKIDIKEFAHGCELLGVPESKSRRFFRMVDIDRNGVIDGAELLESIFHERIARIDMKLVEAYHAYADASAPEAVPSHHITDVLNIVFSDDETFQTEQSELMTVEIRSQLTQKRKKIPSNVDLFDFRQSLVNILARTLLDANDVLEGLKQHHGERKNKLWLFFMLYVGTSRHDHKHKNNINDTHDKHNKHNNHTDHNHHHNNIHIKPPNPFKGKPKHAVSDFLSPHTTVGEQQSPPPTITFSDSDATSKTRNSQHVKLVNFASVNENIATNNINNNTNNNASDNSTNDATSNHNHDVVATFGGEGTQANQFKSNHNRSKDELLVVVVSRSPRSASQRRNSNSSNNVNNPGSNTTNHNNSTTTTNLNLNHNHNENSNKYNDNTSTFHSNSSSNANTSNKNNNNKNNETNNSNDDNTTVQDDVKSTNSFDLLLADNNDNNNHIDKINKKLESKSNSTAWS